MTQNPTIISQSKEAEEDRGWFKITLFALLGILSVYAGSYFFNEFLITALYSRFFASVLFFVLFLAFVVLYPFIIKSGVKKGLILLLQAIAALSVFFDRLYPVPNYILLGAGLVLCLFLLSGINRSSQILNNSLSIKFLSATKAGLPKMVTGLLIFLSVLFYLNYFEWGKFTDKLGQNLVVGIIDSSEPVVKFWFSDINFSGSVGTFLDSVALSQLKRLRFDAVKSSQNNFADNFQNLLPAQKAAMEKQVSLGLKTFIENKVGPLNASAPLKEMVYSLLKKNFNQLPSATKSIFGLLSAFVFFLTLKGFAFLFYWLIEAVAFIIYKFLIITGLAYISLESRSREFVILK
ncbi:MAG: hypothetical protein AAB617_01235 [Patescibacteria group bacterium]